MVGDPESDIDREGGRELRSGAIGPLLYEPECATKVADGGEYRNTLEGCMRATSRQVWTLSEEKAIEGLEEVNSPAIKSNDGVGVRCLRESNV